MPVKLFDQASALARAGRPKDAVALIENAAAAGDPDGTFILAHWLLYGSDRPRQARPDPNIAWCRIRPP